MYLPPIVLCDKTWSEIVSLHEAFCLELQIPAQHMQESLKGADNCVTPIEASNSFLDILLQNKRVHDLYTSRQRADTSGDAPIQ